jgi:hypothetical protein
MKRVAGEHVLAASPHLDPKILEAFVQHGEHAHASWHRIFGTKDVFNGRKEQFVVLETKEQHEAYIDAVDKRPEKDRAFAKKTAGQLGFPVVECWQGTRPQATLEDYVVHATVQTMTRIFAVGKRTSTHDPIWLTEGTAYWFTRTMKGTALWG